MLRIFRPSLKGRVDIIRSSRLRNDPYLDPTVSRVTDSLAGRFLQMRGAEAGRGDAAGGDAVGAQFGGNRVGALLRDAQIGIRAAAGVGVAADLDQRVVV